MATFPGRHFVGPAGDTPALQFRSLPIVAAFKVMQRDPSASARDDG